MASGIVEEVEVGPISISIFVYRYLSDSSTLVVATSEYGSSINISDNLMVGYGAHLSAMGFLLALIRTTSWVL